MTVLFANLPFGSEITSPAVRSQYISGRKPLWLWRLTLAKNTPTFLTLSASVNTRRKVKSKGGGKTEAKGETCLSSDSKSVIATSLIVFLT